MNIQKLKGMYEGISKHIGWSRRYAESIELNEDMMITLNVALLAELDAPKMNIPKPPQKVVYEKTPGTVIQNIAQQNIFNINIDLTDLSQVKQVPGMTNVIAELKGNERFLKRKSMCEIDANELEIIK